MDMKDFSKYLTYETFDEILHQIRRISSERTAEAELSLKIYEEGQDKTARKTA